MNLPSVDMATRLGSANAVEPQTATFLSVKEGDAEIFGTADANSGIRKIETRNKQTSFLRNIKNILPHNLC
jgi:hypothetical protein